ncbi:MAG TPA: replication-relaxation family protein [Thermoanaerobaculia bacterium]|nr:replication-relaxation family protein [Thermoanaerobaculia bacterium]
MLKLFSSYCNLTPSQLAILTGRLPHAVRRNLRTMAAENYARFVPPLSDRFGENVWFLTQKGWDICRAMGWVDRRVEATDEKSNKNIPHDMVITRLHMALMSIYGDQLYWTQLHQDCYRRFGKGENDRINADAYFSFPAADGHGFCSFFLEVENTGESKYANGKSSRVRKMEAYAEYAKGFFQDNFGGDDFRVMVLLPTTEGVCRFLGKLFELGGAVATRRFWATDYSSAFDLSSTATVFASPKDLAKNAARRSYEPTLLHSLADA